MKKVLFSFFLFLFLFVLPCVFGSSYAAYLKFDKQTDTVTADQTFQVQVIIDTGSEQVTSTDSYVTYDSTLFEAQSVTEGTFFPVVTYDITSGKIYIAGIVEDTAVTKTGEGTLATIVFKALKDGTGTLSFDCQGDVGSTSKIIKNDGNGTNIIECTSNQDLIVTIGTGGSTIVPTTAASTSSELPETGVLDNLIKYAVPGTMLLIIGVLIKFVLL